MSKTVGSELNDEIDWENLPEQQEILDLDPLLIDVPEVDDCDCVGECGDC